jgi:hypothetical protein
MLLRGRPVVAAGSRHDGARVSSSASSRGSLRRSTIQECSQSPQKNSGGPKRGPTWMVRKERHFGHVGCPGSAMPRMLSMTRSQEQARNSPTYRRRLAVTSRRRRSSRAADALNDGKPTSSVPRSSAWRKYLRHCRADSAGRVSFVCRNSGLSAAAASVLAFVAHPRGPADEEEQQIYCGEAGDGD